ncbi:hypothetical protein H4R18_005852 [Coemansia javaensis]|uniref:Uncharacterized protein n=1 Tax=Coemansia javaensis TaxID=2761396 RepID=A0A9W8H539_9FUNG|nr:hypothetical protein H4R18_005852 [Coemansia javaensis]
MSVLQKQRFFQSGHGPIYMRTPASRLIVTGLAGLIAGGTLYGMFNIGRLVVGNKP